MIRNICLGTALLAAAITGCGGAVEGAGNDVFATAEAAAPVQLYQHCDYGGWTAAFSTTGSFDAAAIAARGGKDNDASSIRVASGYKVTLFDGNASGKSVVVSADNACFVGLGFNDIASSLKIEKVTLSSPPATWKEHWFEHNQTLDLISFNDDVAVYFDHDVNRANTDWILPFDTAMWRYVKQTYGDFGTENRLYLIYHQGKYGGGHPSTYFDGSHDFRNVSDVGPGPWNNGAGGQIDLHSHETGHIVEGASRGVHGSPAFGLWGDSKWAEFFQYDLYVGLGRTADAQRVFNSFTNTSDNFPVAGAHWFRDWFYPLWRDRGHAQVMVRFFQLLAQHFPKSGSNYARDMSWGEYVHFMSGAAQTNLKAQATTAFGWPSTWEQQFNKARSDFPQVTY